MRKPAIPRPAQVRVALDNGSRRLTPRRAQRLPCRAHGNGMAYYFPLVYRFTETQFRAVGDSVILQCANTIIDVKKPRCRLDDPDNIIAKTKLWIACP